MANAPDLEKLVSSFASVADEVAKFPQIPVTKQGPLILGPINELRLHIDQQFGLLQAEKSTLREEVDTLRTEVDTLRKSVDTIHAQLKDVESRHHAE